MQQENMIHGYFGTMLPGYLCMTSYYQHSFNTFYQDILIPPGAHSIAFFLLQQLPINHAACLFYSKPPFDGTCFIGAIANERASDIFPLDNLANQMVKIVIVISPIDESVIDLVQLTSTREQQLKPQVTIAQNLYNYLTAYNKEFIINGEETDVMILPMNVLAMWYYRFMQKFMENPNFYYKTTS
ncbi:hypothetical protein pb186bvf_013067 [Paramecium bursaria]